MHQPYILQYFFNQRVLIGRYWKCEIQMENVLLKRPPQLTTRPMDPRRVSFSGLIEGLEALPGTSGTQHPPSDIQIPTLKFKLKKCKALPKGRQMTLEALKWTSTFGVKVVGVVPKFNKRTISSSGQPDAKMSLKAGSLFAL